MVMARPVRKADNYWSVMVRLVSDDYSTTFDNSVGIGDTTRFIGNAKPELSETGKFIYIACLRYEIIV